MVSVSGSLRAAVKLSGQREGDAVRLKVLTGGRWFPPLVIAVAGALVIPSVNAGLRGDDYVLLGILSASDGVLDGYPALLDIFNFFVGEHPRTPRLPNLGVLPWW